MAALSREISQKIEELSRYNYKTRGSLVNFLEGKLKGKEVTAQDILSYAERSRWKDAQSYIISPEAINKIGICVEELEDKKQAKFAPQFYKLAADRNSEWGCRNYAECLLDGKANAEQPSKEALRYAEKAVSLDSKKHTHKFILSQCLKENKQYQKANIALIEFVGYSKFKEESTKVKNKALTLCHDIFNLDIAEKILEERDSKDYLILLDSFLCLHKLPDGFGAIKQKALFLKGHMHEQEGKLREAMTSYCKITNENPQIFEKAIAARAKILKEQAYALLYSESQSANSQPSIGKTQDLQHGVQASPDFRGFWSKEATWFYSVGEDELDKESQAYKAQISAEEEKVLRAETEDKLYKKSKADETQISTKKLELEPDLNSRKRKRKQRRAELDSQLTFFNASIEPYFPGNRRSIRAHGAESRFFDFKRSTKKGAILGLTCKIIDQRVRVSGAVPDPIDLTNISTRVLITAEKLFQTIIKIPGNSSRSLISSRFVDLALPIANEREWENQYSRGTNYYAPPECYKIGATVVQSEHRTNPKTPRLGDSFLPQIGPYFSSKKCEPEDVYSSLMRITVNGDVGNTKKIAEWMIRYGKSQNSVTLEELRSLSFGVTQDDVDKFNRICFLVMAKEQVQWLSATHSDYQLGMTVAQARCLIMMKAGFITLKEAFSGGALFGVYTGSGLADDSTQLANPCKAINDLYLVYLQSQNLPDYINFFKKYICKERGETHKPRTWVLTREQAHQDLKAVYGGDSDSDIDQEYHSDLSDSEDGSGLAVEAPMKGPSI